MSTRLLIVAGVLPLCLIGGLAQAQEPTPPPETAAPSNVAPPEEAFFSANLLLGMETGIRAELALYREAHHSYVIEGFYGYLLSNLGTAETGGVGGRAIFRRCSGDNSYLLGPGVDAFAQVKSDGAILVAPNLDIAGLHGHGSGTGWETGLNLGVGIGVAGHKNGNDGRPVSGMVTPLISFYTGLRF
jgi:hypothetical protein